MAFKPVVVSGTRPTGHLHLGNYIGAVRQYVSMQEKFDDCYFFIADLHSLTTHPNPNDLNSSVYTVLAEYLACGLDPNKITLYRQSDVPEVIELYLVLNMLAKVGELERVVTFKDKVRQHPDNVNAGLLTYPTLMAADILIHKGTLVPVGKDQEQHLEMTRNFAQRFNDTYHQEVLPEPQAYSSQENLIKVPGLAGSGKMSKSEDANSAIFLADEPALTIKKIKRAVTDAGPVLGAPMSESILNLFTLLGHVSTPEVVADFTARYGDASIRYGDLKGQLAEDMVTYLAPIREKIIVFSADKVMLDKVLVDGAERARHSAQNVINEVRTAIGLKAIYAV
ncbi:MAG: tryptophan--tRNA ligase [Bacteroidota bacterium]|nr:tryptophan--tRNA ligase [Bacteroidota bacterium]